jgi:transcriptional regulator with XRE-family HTH domain
METLAQRLVARRHELGLNPVDLASAVGVSISAVLQWESGKTKNLKNEYLFSVADALNVAPRWLATGKGSRVAAASREAYSIALSRRDESENDKQKRSWERIAAVFARAAMVMVLALPPLLSQPQAQFNNNTDCRRSMRRLWSMFLLSYRIAKLSTERITKSCFPYIRCSGCLT